MNQYSQLQQLCFNCDQFFAQVIGVGNRTVALYADSVTGFSLLNPDPNFVFWLMLLHCLIGLSASIVADSKGYSFPLWLLIGSIGGTFGLIASLRLPKKSC